VIEFTHSVSLEASISSIFRFSSSASTDMNFRLSAKSLRDIGFGFRIFHHQQAYSLVHGIPASSSGQSWKGFY